MLMEISLGDHFFIGCKILKKSSLLHAQHWMTHAGLGHMPLMTIEQATRMVVKCKAMEGHNLVFNGLNGLNGNSAAIFG